MSQKKKWSASKKFEIALLAIKGETTLSDLCKRYEVAVSQVHAWKKELLERGSELFAKNEKSSTNLTNKFEQEQSQLYEKIGQLTVERDFLKKAWSKLHGRIDES